MRVPALFKLKAMRAHLKLGSMFGIPVNVHVSFLLIIGLVTVATWPDGWRAVLEGIVFVLAAYSCVVLHEFGHILMARRYGIGTRQVLLLPVGGVAFLERIPDKPKEELAVIAAGPAVNVVLAAILGPLAFVLWQVMEAGPMASVMEGTGPGGWLEFILALAIWNVVMAVFNMVPAFPMDGGRILRALLQFRFGRLRATRYAVYVARVVTVFAFGFAVWNQLLVLALVAVFILVLSTLELRVVERQEEDKMRASVLGLSMPRAEDEIEGDVVEAEVLA